MTDQDQIVRERAAEARNFLHSDTVSHLFAVLRERYVLELLECEVGGLTAATAHAKMKALEDMKIQLQAFVTDEKFLRRR